MPDRPLSNVDLLDKIDNCVGISEQSVEAFDFENVDLLKLATRMLHSEKEQNPSRPEEGTKN